MIVLPQTSWMSLKFPEISAMSAAYFTIPWRSHLYGFSAGALAFAGMLANFLAAKYLGFAIAYGIGMTSPAIAIMWGVCFYGEFTGCTWATWSVLLLSLATYLSALALLVMADDG